MGMGQEAGTSAGHGGITYAFQTQFSRWLQWKWRKNISPVRCFSASSTMTHLEALCVRSLVENTNHYLFKCDSALCSCRDEDAFIHYKGNKG